MTRPQVSKVEMRKDEDGTWRMVNPQVGLQIPRADLEELVRAIRRNLMPYMEPDYK